MLKAKRLRIGDTIGVVAPASPTTKEKVEKAHKKLIEMGFKVKMGKTCYSSYGYLAGSDELRAKDLINMFKDKEVDGIICLKGGYGTPRILDLLDYEVIKNNPKVFVGYSDITALHIAFNQLSDLATFHGPMVASDFIGEFSEFTEESLLNAILKEEFKPTLKNPPGKEIMARNGGAAEGTIIGGNLTLITGTIGTDYEIDTRGKILLIEEIEEEPYKIDKMLTQLRLSKKLEEAEGIIFGNFNNCVSKDSQYDYIFTMEEIIDNTITPSGKPILFNIEAGHCEPAITIPFGVKARLDADSKELIIMEKPTL